LVDDFIHDPTKTLEAHEIHGKYPPSDDSAYVNNEISEAIVDDLGDMVGDLIYEGADEDGQELP